MNIVAKIVLYDHKPWLVDDNKRRRQVMTRPNADIYVRR